MSRKISIKNISKILELYSLQITVVEATAKDFEFSIKNLNFGNPIPVEGETYSKTSVNMNFYTNENMLKEFVRFLQTGKFSQKFEVMGENGQIDQRAYRYLQQNLLPIAQIESINILDEAVDDIPGKLSVGLQFNLFSQTQEQ